MKKIMQLNTVLWLPILLTGCGIGLGLFPSAVSHNIKPFLHFWDKEGVTSSDRQSDSRECGSTLLPSARHQDGISFVQKGAKYDATAYDRAKLAWQHCMIKKGYRYNGDCSSDAAKVHLVCTAR